jgi:hypothetical protein
MPRPKGLPKTGGRQRGSLNKTTLLKEERRAIFDEQVSKIWVETIHKLKPEYIATQFMGKVPDELKVSGEIQSRQLTSKQIEAINKIALDNEDEECITDQFMLAASERSDINTGTNASLVPEILALAEAILKKRKLKGK